MTHQLNVEHEITCNAIKKPTQNLLNDYLSPRAPITKLAHSETNRQSWKKPAVYLSSSLFALRTPLITWV